MTPEEIKAAAQSILENLTDEELQYARTEARRRTAAGESENTPFSCLHDLMDANELLPEGSIKWDAEGGPDFTDANAIMDAFNDLVTGMMQRKFFQIDCLGETPVEAYDSGETWNGWGSPLFSFEQGQALVALWHHQGWAARYDEKADAFVFSVNQDFETGHSDEFETFSAIQHKEEKFYPIGSGSWIWDEAETPEVRTPDRQYSP